MPKLAEDLLKEKNYEIDGLKRKLREMNDHSGVPVQSTPVSWTMAGDNTSSGSMERLRDAPAMSRNLPDISALAGRSEGHIPSSKVSVGHLDPIHESFSTSLDLKECQYIEEHRTSLNSKKSESRAPLEETGGSIVPAPGVDLTKGNTQNLSNSYSSVDEINELKELLEHKAVEMESLSAVVHAKEALIYDLQDRIQDAEEQTNQLGPQVTSLQDQVSTKVKELEEAALREKRLCEDLEENMLRIKTLQDEVQKLSDAHAEKVTELKSMERALNEGQERIEGYVEKVDMYKEKVRELENKLLEDGEPNLVTELKRLKEENTDRVEGMENLHSIIQEQNRKLKFSKKI